jgi:hypothetical protein
MWTIIYYLLGCSFFTNDKSSSSTTLSKTDSEKKDDISQTIDPNNDSPDAIQLPFKIVEEPSNLDRKTRSALTPYIGPLIDTHAHIWYQATKKPDIVGLKDLLNKHSVTKIIFMPTALQGISSKPAIATAEKQGKGGNKQKKKINKSQTISNKASQKVAIIRELGNDRVGWFCDSQGIIEQLQGEDAVVESRRTSITKKARQDIKNPLCLGIGELGVARGSKREGQPSVFVEFDHGILMEVIDDVSQAEKWVDVYLEPINIETEEFRQSTTFFSILNVCNRFPTSKLIISHTMMTNPSNVQQLMTHCPNLYSNITIVHEEWEKWVLLEPIHTQAGLLYEDWATLFETLPTRFFIGSNAKLFRDGEKGLQSYEETLQWYRNLLGTLKPDVAEKIAYQNAERFLKTVK